MEAINYKSVQYATRVYLGRKRVGTIRAVFGGWVYFPYGHPKDHGKVYPSIADCKRSIEQGDEA